MSDNGLVLSLFGICCTGFFVLMGWMWWMVGQMSKRVTYEWIKTNVDTKLDEIKGALMGDMDKEGIISRLRRIDENCINHRKQVGDK